MQLDLRALYNHLRMTWLGDPDLAVEPWQVEDYRSSESEDLFQRLKTHGITLDRASFVEAATDYDSPEDLSEDLLPDDAGAAQEDQIFLILFELWRRFVPEKQSLSVFCDELDHQINLYDTGEAIHPEDIQDALANLQNVLDENSDQGVDPEQVFESLMPYCANDLESFLYDYIAEQIDSDTATYASELVEGFYPYVGDKEWFDFLRARIVGLQDMMAANELLWDLVDAEQGLDLELLLEMLAFLVQGGEKELFAQVGMQAAELLRTEEELQDFMEVCIDFYRCLDHEKEERVVQDLLARRRKNDPDALVKANDPDLQKLLSMVEVFLPAE